MQNLAVYCPNMSQFENTQSLLTIINNSGAPFGSVGVASASSTDLPLANAEFAVFWFGSVSRMNVIASQYTVGKTWIASIFNKKWQTGWVLLH